MFTSKSMFRGYILIPEPDVPITFVYIRLSVADLSAIGDADCRLNSNPIAIDQRVSDSLENMPPFSGLRRA